MKSKHRYGCPSICIRLPQSLLDELSGVAYDERCTISEIVRYALVEYMRQYREHLQIVTASAGDK